MSKVAGLIQECETEFGKFSGKELEEVEAFTLGMNEFAEGKQSEEKLKKIIKQAGLTPERWKEIMDLRFTISGVSDITVSELSIIQTYAEKYKENGNLKGLPKQGKNIKKVLKENGIK